MTRRKAPCRDVRKTREGLCRGAELVALPMAIEGGTGGPLRAVAFLCPASAAASPCLHLLAFLGLVLAFI